MWWRGVNSGGLRGSTRTVAGITGLRCRVVCWLAVECGLWPLKEAINGVVVHTYLPKLTPVEDYLKLQGRFRHLFEPEVQTEAIAHIQERVNAYWNRVKRDEGNS